MSTAKTLFVISLLTSRMIMPGMPKMPPGMGIPDMSAPQKMMTMDLTSDKKVNASSWAQCAVPEGLKLGPKVDLEIDLPVPTETTPGPATAEGKPEVPKFTMKMYWQCSDTVLPGQPKVMDTEKMMKNMPAAAGMMGGKMRPGMMPRKPILPTSGESHAYWPNSKDSKKIVPESSSPGDYKLTTNYCGGTSITLGPEQEFLGGIDITNPGKTPPDLAQAIKIEWKPVPNALAYLITAMAGKQGEMVMWTSASQPEVSVDYMSKALTKAEVDSYIEKGIFLPATATSCYIPAGIFKGIGNPMLTMTAIGADKLQTRDGINTNVIVRSTAMMMLGGMGMMPGVGQNPDETNQPNPNPPDAAVSTEGNAQTPPANNTNPPANNPPKPKIRIPIGGLGGIFKH